MKEQSRRKYWIIALVVVLVVGCATVIPHYAQAIRDAFDSKTVTTGDKNGKPAETRVALGSGNSALTKNETVYAKLNPNGEVKETTVVNWIHYEGEHPASLVDPVSLTDPRALNGSFKVKEDANGVTLSDLPAADQDFYYSGKTDKALPETVNITYYLNGKEIEARDLIGKSGDIKVVFQVHNQLKERVAMAYDGGSRSMDVYTPLVNMISMELPADTFSRVEAGDNGLVTTVGETMKVNWMIFPFPDGTVTLTAKAKNFQLGAVTMVVQPMVPPVPSVEIEDKLKEMNDGLNQMDSALAKLEEGGQRLAAAQGEMRDGMGTISGGLDKLILLNKAQVQIVQGALLINQKILDGVTPLASNATMGPMVQPLIAGLEKQKELLTTMLNGGEINGQTVPAMSITGDKLGEVKGGLDKLEAGADSTAEGADQISNGVAQVREQGIKKMRAGVVSALHDAQAGNSEIDWLKKAVGEYNTFLGKPDNAQGKVQFILETEELK